MDESDETKRGIGAISGSSKPARKTLRNINPLGMRVVVRLRPDNKVSEGGLYLPDSVRDTMHESVLGEVVEVASAVDIDSEEETNVSGIPLGALVLIPRKAGVRVPWDDELRVVDTKDVLAIVTELEIS